jgi:hypothetical protein
VWTGDPALRAAVTSAAKLPHRKLIREGRKFGVPDALYEARARAGNIRVPPDRTKLVGPFPDEKTAINKALAKVSKLENDTGNEWTTGVVQGSDGNWYFYNPQEGPPPTDGHYHEYLVVPDKAAVRDYIHSHPGDADPGADDFKVSQPVYIIDSETGDRYRIDPKTGQVQNIGPLHNDPIDGTLPPTDSGTEGAFRSDADAASAFPEPSSDLLWPEFIALSESNASADAAEKGSKEVQPSGSFWPKFWSAF